MSDGKGKKYWSSNFSYLFHISNFKILSLTVLDRMQSVTHGQTDGQTQTNMPPQEVGGIKMGLNSSMLFFNVDSFMLKVI